MSYKLDPEKGFKLLRCVSPPVIFLNGPYSVGKSEFANKFKKEDFSVLNLVGMNEDKMVDTVQKYLKNRRDKYIDHHPVIIEACVTDDELISNMFSGEFHNFTYVYVYPNNSKKYKEKLISKIKAKSPHPFTGETAKLIQLISSSDEATADKLSTKLTVELINSNKTVYNNHLETFDNKILTILI